jgi:hypothetical protein
MLKQKSPVHIYLLIHLRYVGELLSIVVIIVQPNNLQKNCINNCSEKVHVNNDSAGIPQAYVNHAKERVK